MSNTTVEQMQQNEILVAQIVNTQSPSSKGHGHKKQQTAVLGNFLYALMKALEGKQELTDKLMRVAGTTASQDACLQKNIMTSSNATLAQDEKNINFAYKEEQYFAPGSKNANSKDESFWSTQAQEAQNQFSTDNTEANSQQSQADGALQAATQGATQPATDLGNLAKVGQTILSIMSTLTSLLGQVVS